MVTTGCRPWFSGQLAGPAVDHVDDHQVLARTRRSSRCTPSQHAERFEPALTASNCDDG
jgi:hypothetical protein